MAIRRAPGSAYDLVGEVRVDLADLIAGDHAHIEALGHGLVAQALENLDVAVGLAETEVSALAVLDIGTELLGKGRPEMLHGIHRKRKLARVAAGLADAAAIPRRSAIADDVRGLEHDDRGALLCQIVCCRTADDASTDDNHVSRALGDVGRRSLCHLTRHPFHLPSRIRSSRSDAWEHAS